jgi:hypothetical protein
MRNAYRWVRNTFLVLVVAGLAACSGGGDGGGGGSPPNPLGTTQVNLNNSNAGTFATFVNSATRLGAATRFGPSLTPVSNGLQYTACLVIGGGASTVTFALQPPNGPGPVTGSATYLDYDNCYFLRLNGTASVMGTLGTPIGPNAVDSFTLTFSDFNYTAFHAAGTIALTWKPSIQGSAGYIMTINATVSDANRNVLFRLDNFEIDSDLSAGTESVLVSGRLTAAAGFVDISSTNRLTLPFPSTGFQTGTLTMTGLSQTAAVTYNGNGAFTFVITP